MQKVKSWTQINPKKATTATPKVDEKSMTLNQLNNMLYNYKNESLSHQNLTSLDLKGRQFISNLEL